jgi:DNA-binding SARP family transcriptional activator
MSGYVDETSMTIGRNPSGVGAGNVEVLSHLDDSMVRFRALGPLEIVHGGRECTPSAPKVLQVLALLVLRANQIVHMDTLIEQLWGEHPPRSALTTIQTYIYQLRRFLERNAFVGNGEEIVVTRVPGYILRVDPRQIDLQRFEQLAAIGRDQFRQGQYAEAARHLRAALALWTRRVRREPPGAAAGRAAPAHPVRHRAGAASGTDR